METRRIHLPDLAHHFISHHALEKLLCAADSNACLAYLYLLREKGQFAISHMMETLGFSEQEAYAALQSLSRMGLTAGHAAGSKTAETAVAKPREDAEVPQYSAAEMERLLQADAAFSSVVKEIGNVLGKVLTTPDLNILVGLYHHLGLPLDVMYQLVCHLTAEHRQQRGEGTAPTLRGIEKIAYEWVRMGITTLDAAMEHIEQRAAQKTQLTQLKKILDLKQGKLTPTQEKYMRTWLNMGFALDTIALAYDKAIIAAGAPLQWKYLNAVLSNWHKKNLLTPEQAALEKSSFKPQRQTSAKQTIKTATLTQEELMRKQKLLEELKGG